MLHQELCKDSSVGQKFFITSGFWNGSLLEDVDVVHEGEDGDWVGDQDAGLVLQEAVPAQNVVEDVFACKTITSWTSFNLI